MASSFNKEEILRLLGGTSELPSGKSKSRREPLPPRSTLRSNFPDPKYPQSSEEKIRVKDCAPGQWILTKGREIAQIRETKRPVKLVDGTWVQPSIICVDEGGNNLLVFEDQILAVFNNKQEAEQYKNAILPKRTKGADLIAGLKNFVYKVSANIPPDFDADLTNVPGNVPEPKATTSPDINPGNPPNPGASNIKNRFKREGIEVVKNLGRIFSKGYAGIKAGEQAAAKGIAGEFAPKMLGQGPTFTGKGDAPIMTSQPFVVSASKKTSSSDDSEEMAKKFFGEDFIESFRKRKEEEREKILEDIKKIFGKTPTETEKAYMKEKRKKMREEMRGVGSPKGYGTSSLGRMVPTSGSASSSSNEWKGTVHEMKSNLVGKFVIVPGRLLRDSFKQQLQNMGGNYILEIVRRGPRDARTKQVEGVYVKSPINDKAQAYVLAREIYKGLVFPTPESARGYLVNEMAKESKLVRAVRYIAKKSGIEEALYDPRKKQYSPMNPEFVARYYADKYLSPAEVPNVGRVEADPDSIFQNLQQSLALFLGPAGYKLSYDKSNGDVYMVNNSDPDVKVYLGNIKTFNKGGSKVSFKAPDPKGKVHPLPETTGSEMTLDRKTPPNLPLNPNEFENGGGKILGHGEKEGLEGQAQPLSDSKMMKKFIKRIRKQDPTPVFKLSV